MQNPIFTTILDQAHTTADVDLLLQKIDEVLGTLYQLSQKEFSTILSHELSPALIETVQQTFSEQKLSWSHPEEIKQFMLSLKTALSTTTVLTLTIAIPSSGEEIVLFSKKAKELFGPATILEIVTQESIIGGAIIILKGNYLDHSVSKKVKDIFKNTPKDITSILKTTD